MATPEQLLKRRDYMRQWVKDNPEKARLANQKNNAKRRLRLKGVTQEQYDAMLAQQGGCCAICGTSENNRPRDWDIDHCHEQGHVRGLLCYSCNLLLGHAKDNITTLQSAIKYLERSTCPTV